MESAILEQSIPLGAIEVLAGFNPRQSFEPEPAQQLLDSIKARGVLQPLLVRPHPKRAGLYWLIAGERRLRAAKQAGLAAVPARVLQATDTEALELALMENLQRADLHPLEEARGIARLHQELKLPLAEIQQRLGKSRSHVYDSLKLVALSAPAQAAFQAGRLDRSRALLVSRLADPEFQARAVKEITTPDCWGGGVPSVRRAQDIIHDRYMVDLRRAPFRLDDPKLMPDAGPCTTCPHRSANHAGTSCGKPTCYRAKVEVAWIAAKSKALEAGWEIVDAQQTPALIGTGNNPYAPLTDTTWRGSRSVTFGELLKKSPKTKRYLVRTKDGGFYQAIKRADFEARPAPDNWRARDNAERKARQGRRAISRAVLAAAADQLAERASREACPARSWWHLVIAQVIELAFIHNGTPQQWDLLCQRYGVKVQPGKDAFQAHQRQQRGLLTAVSKLPARQLPAVLVELLVMNTVQDYTGGLREELDAWARFYRVDLAKIKRTAAAAAKQKADPAAPTKQVRR